MNRINSIEKCARFTKQNRYKYIVQFGEECAYFTEYITNSFKLFSNNSKFPNNEQ